MHSLWLYIRRLVLSSLLLVSIGLTSSCSGVSPLSLLTGSGPNVAANVQAGKVNSQTIGKTSNTEIEATGASQKVSGSTKVQADGVDQITVNEVSTPLVALLTAMFILWSYLLWKLPSPEQIWKRDKQ